MKRAASTERLWVALTAGLMADWRAESSVEHSTAALRADCWVVQKAA